MNVVIFVRGYNITGQVEECKVYAERKGYNVLSVVVGEARELPAVIGGLGENIDRVIVRDMARISRNALENYTIQTELELDYGVLIESATARGNTEAEEIFMRNIIKAVQREQRLQEQRSLFGRMVNN